MLKSARNSYVFITFTKWTSNARSNSDMAVDDGPPEKTDSMIGRYG